MHLYWQGVTDWDMCGCLNNSTDESNGCLVKISSVLLEILVQGCSTLNNYQVHSAYILEITFSLHCALRGMIGWDHAEKQDQNSKAGLL